MEHGFRCCMDGGSGIVVLVLLLCLGQTARSKRIKRWTKVLNWVHIRYWMSLHGVILIELVMHGETWITFRVGESVRCGKV